MSLGKRKIYGKLKLSAGSARSERGSTVPEPDSERNIS
jgi:hypothetical protein